MSDFAFDTSQLEWIQYDGSPAFDYPIDYRVAVLGYDEAIGRMDLVVQWAPDSYCHFHRHMAATSTLVLEGEHHVIDVDENGVEGDVDVRPAGTYRISSGGDLHMERGGPEGCTVLFAMQHDEGRMFDVVDRDLNLLAATTIATFVDAARGVDADPSAA